MNLPKTYISGALTDATHPEELKRFYETLGRLCSHLGLAPYVPHLVTDPQTHPEVPPREVFETDKTQVLSSSLVIAYVGQPSLGVGMEIAYAETANIPIILLYEKGKEVSRLARGAPAIVAEITYSTELEALTQVQAAIIGMDELATAGKLSETQLAELLKG